MLGCGIIGCNGLGRFGYVLLLRLYYVVIVHGVVGMFYVGLHVGLCIFWCLVGVGLVGGETAGLGLRLVWCYLDILCALIVGVIVGLLWLSGLGVMGYC